MNIGILTFYRVANFGANLQALSTYYYLRLQGHNPIMINYYDKDWYMRFSTKIDTEEQVQAHIEFVEKYMPNQTEICYTSDDINLQVSMYQIEAIIIGSDAVVQHHPIISRINRGKRKPIYIAPVSSDRVFPNPLWGVGIISDVKLALMSGSSQNSKYKYFSTLTRRKMRKALDRFRYLGVRDRWTLKMFNEGIGISNVHLTPDPVFAMNYNASHLIPSRRETIVKYHIPENYILVSLRGQCIPYNELENLKEKLEQNGLVCIALPMPEGITFNHPFDIEVSTPLSPIDWYALIKYSNGYIGCNMHPIVVSLHNAVPCYSIDNWGTRNWKGEAIDDHSSKVEDILDIFGVKENRVAIGLNECHINVDHVVDRITHFPSESVLKIASKLYSKYEEMMNDILYSFQIIK